MLTAMAHAHPGSVFPVMRSTLYVEHTVHTHRHGHLVSLPCHIKADGEAQAASCQVCACGINKQARGLCVDVKERRAVLVGKEVVLGAGFQEVVNIP